MDRATNLLTLLGALFAFIVIVMIGDPTQINWWLAASGAIAWALSPYAVMWLLNNVLVQEQRQRDIVLLLTCIVMVALESWNLGHAMLGNDPSSLAGILHQLPLIQLIVAIIGGAVAYLMPVAMGKRANS